MRKALVIAIGLVLALYTSACSGGFDDGYMGRRYHAPTQAPLPQSIQPLPNGSYIYGVDVSAWQGTINWDSLKAAVSFAIMRASYGSPYPGETVAQYTDKQLRPNQSEARRVGILRGYYHYAYPQYNNNPIPEADQFLNAIGPLQAGEILCLDFEESYYDPVGWCVGFLNRIYSVTGIRPLLYINYYTSTRYDWSPVINGGYGLWLADWDYIANPTLPATQWQFNVVKQYSNKGSVAGLSPVDLDVFNGGSSQFLAYGGKSPSIAAQPLSQSVPLGSAAAFTVAASGTSPHYQWRRNGTNIAGATSSTYTTGTPGSYDCAVSNSFGSVRSNTAGLTISGATTVAFVGAAKQLPDGAVVKLSSGLVVAGVLNGFFYIEDANRNAGVRVVPSQPVTIAEGSTATIYGALQTIDGERVISNAIVTD